MKIRKKPINVKSTTARREMVVSEDNKYIDYFSEYTVKTLHFHVFLLQRL